MNRKRLGLLDLFAIAMILLSAVGLILRMQALRATEQDDDYCTLVLRARAIWEETVDCVEVGEELALADGTEWGTVQKIDAPPAILRTLKDGVVIEGEWASGRRRDLILIVTARGRAGEDAFLLDGRRAILVGEEVVLYGSRIALPFTILDVVWE